MHPARHRSQHWTCMGISQPHADRRSKSCLPRGMPSCTVPALPSNGNAAECMQAGVKSGRILFLGPARELRMRIESSASNIILQKTARCLRFFVQVCPVFQLMVMTPPRAFEVTSQLIREFLSRHAAWVQVHAPRSIIGQNRASLLVLPQYRDR
jgi:hypothetical protein